MFFWFIAALLTLGACLAVLAPLARRPLVPEQDIEHDLEVYRDQLSELEEEAARGMIEPNEAEQARAEIGRRILKLSADGETTPRKAPTAFGLSRVTAMAAVLSVPLVSWGFYAAFGSPDLPAQPLQARLDGGREEASVADLVARAEAHLAENPSDARGWEVLAPVYMRMGRGGDAVTAWQNAIQLDGENAARQTGLGEAMVAMSGGIVSFEAQQAFERALELEPGNARARYFLASGYMQDGRREEAVSIFQAMISELPAESPWRGAAMESLREAGVETAGEAAEADDQAEMIEGMVASLDARLREEPDDAEGWQRLVRSYVVLGRQDQAHEALQRGLDALGETSEAGMELANFALSLGVRPMEVGQ